MATFTNISDTVLEPGKPIRSVDALALRDNPVAIAGGASGAPRIVTNAIENANVTAAKLATGNNERDWVLDRTAGASVGAVGTYAFLRAANLTVYAPGNTLAGSSLRYQGAHSNIEVSSGTRQTGDGGTPAGTWRLMGNRSSNDPSFGNSGASSLWLRIS
jgi:hypothetical protein